MHVLILGGAGMIGRKLAERLAREGRLGDTPVSKLTLYDVVAPEKPKGAAFAVETLTGDLPSSGETDRLVAARPDVIFMATGIRPVGGHEFMGHRAERVLRGAACATVVMSS